MTRVETGVAVRSRSTVLETAILGILNEAPLHGYELRKELKVVLGSFRALSYGSLYPCLKGLATRGLILAVDAADAPPHALAGKRARIVYELTAEGKEQLQSVLAESGPAAWEDESFDVRFALFAQTDVETRLRILEGRRMRLTERLEVFREGTVRARERLDEYTQELQRHGLEQVEHEVRWLDELIDTERGRNTVELTRAPRTTRVVENDPNTTRITADGEKRHGTDKKERG